MFIRNLDKLECVFEEKGNKWEEKVPFLNVLKKAGQEFRFSKDFFVIVVCFKVGYEAKGKWGNSRWKKLLNVSVVKRVFFLC